MYIQPQIDRDLKKIPLLITSRLNREAERYAIRTVVPAKCCQKITGLLKAVWQHQREGKEEPRDLAKYCVRTRIILEESVWDEMDELPLTVGSGTEDDVYNEWLDRNVKQGYKDPLKVTVLLRGRSENAPF